MKLFFRTTVVLLCVLTSRHDAEALQNLFTRFGGGGGSTSKAAPLCKRVDLGTLSVSPMGLGTLNLPLDKEVDDETFSVLKTAREFDVNFVDTAEAVSFAFCLRFMRMLAFVRFCNDNNNNKENRLTLFIIY